MVRILIICLLFTAVICPTSVQAIVWTDAMGRSVELPATPQRIVSLVPSVTEILFALDLGDRIVGVTRFCTYPEEAKSKPQVGDYSNPSLEAVLLQHPDLVIISAASASPALLGRMERLGLSVYIIYPHGIAETIATIRALGQVTGATLKGEQMARQLAATVEQVQAAVAGRTRPRVLFCVMVQPLTVAGPGTLIDDLITVAGGENVVPAGPGRYPTWGDEALLLADPDIIIVSPHPGTPNPVDHFAAWPSLTAVKEHRIVSVTPDWVHRPGPRLILGLAAMVKAIHGINLDTVSLPVQP